MIRRIEDITPPDRPKEMELPPITPTETTDSAQNEGEEQERLDHELPNLDDQRHYIDEPPPFISRIPPRDGSESSFLDRPREERKPLAIPQSDRRLTFLAPRSIVLILGSLFLCYIILSMAFRKVTIEVTPNSAKAVLNSHILAKKGDPIQLPFTVLTLTATETKRVEASGTKVVNTKSTGIIIVYNEYSSKSQRLIKNTRFQTSDGKIYRIAESITVPGVTTVAGKTVPGRVEVTVFGDEAGPLYNIGLSDFTIPGLKGDPRFEKMYARSKTPMTGGFSGSMKVVSDDELARSRQELEGILRAQLEKQARDSQPKEHVMYSEGMYLVSRPLERRDIEGEEQAVLLESSGELYVLLFPRKELTLSLAKDAIPNYDGAPIEIQNLEALRLTVDTPSNTDPWLSSELSLTLTGDAEFIWTVNESQLKEALLGKRTSEFHTILEGFASIEEAKAKFRPFWWSKTFPGNSEKMSIILPEQELKVP